MEEASKPMTFPGSINVNFICCKSQCPYILIYTKNAYEYKPLVFDLPLYFRECAQAPM